MKKYMIIVALFSFAFGACNDSKKEEAESELDDLQTWLEDVKENSSERTLESWQKIETEYLQAKSKLDSTQENLSIESKQAYKTLQEEFDDMNLHYQLDLKANEHIKKIETWLIIKSDTTIQKNEEDLIQIEEEWKEFKTEFSETAEEISDDTKEKWNTLENRINQWIEYDLKQNFK